jgi:hypothetical protein
MQTWELFHYCIFFHSVLNAGPFFFLLGERLCHTLVKSVLVVFQFFIKLNLSERRS